MIPLDSAAVRRAARDAPPWLGEARERAFAEYERLAMPSPSEELWRYLELDLDLGGYRLPTEADAPAASGSGPAISVVDGISRGDGIQGDGLVVTSLASHWAAVETDPAAFASPEPAADKFSAAHRAFGLDGAAVIVSPRTVVEDPIYIDVVATSTDAVSFPRVLVDLGATAEASVVVRFSSPDGIEALVVPELEILVGDGSNLRFTVLQEWGTGTTSLGRARIEAGRDGSFTFAEAGLGAALSRLHLAVDLVGRGSSASVVGAYFGEDEQVLDYRYFMRHAAENTTSDMFLKGAVEDAALSVFTGMIRIEEEGQRTNAFQTNRNLLLSGDASAQSVPNLEILANDVKCGHGSTVGPLDAEQRYYLMTRGLQRDAADRLQVRGFFEEALARFPEDSVLDPVRSKIAAKFEDAQKEGRV